MSNINQKKIVLVIGGHDPSGGAGIQADIESIIHAGCHPVTVITSLTTQNTREVVDINPQNPETFRRQIRLIMDDMHIDACKIGMFGDTGLIDVVCDELLDKDIPIILDPVIRSGSGTTLADEQVCHALIKRLLPLTTLITPNSEEARILSNEKDLTIAASTLLQYGTNAVLITGTHEESEDVVNTLYLKDRNIYKYNWQRLPETYHGSGCTLSSSIAAYLAQGEGLKSAVEKAQNYTWETLQNGIKLGHGQILPNRFFDK